MSGSVAVVLDALWQSFGWAPSDQGWDLRSGPTPVAGDLPVTDMATGAYAALAMAAAHLHSARGGDPLAPFVDRRLAGLALTGNDFVRIDGVEPDKWGPITGYFRCKDGGYVYLHGQFPHLRDGLLNLFGAQLDRTSMAAALQNWNAQDAETAGQERGLCVMRVRDRAEWEAHSQRAVLAKKPVAEMIELGNGTRPLPVAGSKPLSSVRVLDLSRVLAGPMAGRALAELGADVLRISAPNLPSLEQLVIDTGFGKRAAFADIKTEEGRANLNALISDADILIDGFRPGVLAAQGYGVENLRDLNPSLSIITLSAFSTDGPWGGRRGYDSYVQGGVGLTAPPVKGDPPIRLSTQPLDYLVGCLCACGGVIAMIKRMERQSHLIEMSLARTAMWVWELADQLGPDTSAPAANMTIEDLRAEGLIRQTDSAFGLLETLAPPYGFDGALIEWASPPPRLGSAAPDWF